MQRIVSASADHELTFEVERGGRILTLKATPGPARDFRPLRQQDRGQGMIGIRRNAAQEDWEYQRYGPIESIGLGVKRDRVSSSRARCPIWAMS